MGWGAPTIPIAPATTPAQTGALLLPLPCAASGTLVPRRSAPGYWMLALNSSGSRQTLRRS
jgi:hypothetical protein